MAADPKAVAQAFVGHYYRTFDTNRPAIASLYKDVSTLTFEGEEHRGPAIAGKLTSFAASVEHHVTTMDVQVSGSPNAILVFVTGELKIDGGPPLKFSQMFQLVATGPGAFYVHNDVFRLVYG